MAALDHRQAEDVLLPLTAGKDYGTVDAGEAHVDLDRGGRRRRELLDHQRRAGQHLAGQAAADRAFRSAAGGGFTGSPVVMLDNRYGRLLTVVGDPTGLLWLTTSNKDGLGQPVPSDDRVIVVPSGSCGGGGRAGLIRRRERVRTGGWPAPGAPRGLGPPLRVDVDHQQSRFAPSWSITSPSGDTATLPPIPVGALPLGFPTDVAGSACAAASRKLVLSSALALVSRSHCSRLPGPGAPGRGQQHHRRALVGQRLVQARETARRSRSSGRP